MCEEGLESLLYEARDERYQQLLKGACSTPVRQEAGHGVVAIMPEISEYVTYRASLLISHLKANSMSQARLLSKYRAKISLMPWLSIMYFLASPHMYMPKHARITKGAVMLPYVSVRLHP